MLNLSFLFTFFSGNGPEAKHKARQKFVVGRLFGQRQKLKSFAPEFSSLIGGEM